MRLQEIKAGDDVIVEGQVGLYRVVGFDGEVVLVHSDERDPASKESPLQVHHTWIQPQSPVGAA